VGYLAEYGPVAWGLTIWKFISEIDRPYTSTGTNIENAMKRRSGDRSCKQIPIKEKLPYVVSKIEAILFCLVIWVGILSLTVSMVAATIFIDVILDGGRDRGR